MRTILILLSLFSIVSANSQNIDNDSLLFILKGLVRSAETHEVLGNAEVKIIGTDGSSAIVLTDSSGYFESELTSNHAFRVTVYHPDYLIGVGRESTKDLNESKTFAHLYELQEIEYCSGMVPLMLYKEGQYDKPFNPEEGEVIDELYGLLVDNPMLVVDLKGYRDKSEKEAVSYKRAVWAMNYLIAKGLKSDRLNASDGGTLTEVPNSVKENNHHSEIKHNRMVVITIIGEDDKN